MASERKDRDDSDDDDSVVSNGELSPLEKRLLKELQKRKDALELQRSRRDRGEITPDEFRSMKHDLEMWIDAYESMWPEGIEYAYDTDYEEKKPEEIEPLIQYDEDGHPHEPEHDDTSGLQDLAAIAGTKRRRTDDDDESSSTDTEFDPNDFVCTPLVDQLFMREVEDVVESLDEPHNKMFNVHAKGWKHAFGSHKVAGWESMSPQQRKEVRMYHAVAHIMAEKLDHVLTTSSRLLTAKEIELFLKMRGWGHSRIFLDTAMTLGDLAQQMHEYAKERRDEDDEIDKQKYQTEWYKTNDEDKRREFIRLITLNHIKQEMTDGTSDFYSTVPDNRLEAAIRRDPEPLRYQIPDIEYEMPRDDAFVTEAADLIRSLRAADNVIVPDLPVDEDLTGPGVVDLTGPDVVDLTAPDVVDLTGEGIRGSGPTSSADLASADLFNAKQKFQLDPTNRNQCLLWVAQGRAAGLGVDVNSVKSDLNNNLKR